MKKVVIFFLFICISLFSCENGEPPSTDPPFNVDAAIEEISYAFMNWGWASQNKDKVKMYSLSYPGGNFEAMTRTCIEQWEVYNNTYFCFGYSSLKVTSVNKTDATITGVETLIQGPPNGGVNGSHINSRYNFTASAKFYNGKWLLYGIQTHDLIEDW